ncbi:MerR family transcriptional regulator [Sagittula stellata]|uniref:Transcriptional regulator, MerR family protein n=1 Tax=Sagittula stellata (strain ATCC 700073 / DSM 11524 / E-37) TaxID=388399 RepID=A3K1W7_SAGS3|nr:MerR family transcriptional regulator [Sagittula stellata]EBA08913.1 transcriptional regulator, MerR family protein [Sagittula stellata E-37]
MSKSPDAFRTISEVSEWLETPAHVLRFWESKFTQVKPVKRAGGRRYYRPADMELLGGIKKLLHEDGLTIKGVQKVLREQGVRYVSGLSPQVGDEDEDAALIEDAPYIEVEQTDDGVVAFPGRSAEPPQDTPETGQEGAVEPAASAPEDTHEAAAEAAETDEDLPSLPPLDPFDTPDEPLAPPALKPAPVAQDDAVSLAPQPAPMPADVPLSNDATAEHTAVAATDAGESVTEDDDMARLAEDTLQTAFAFDLPDAAGIPSPGETPDDTASDPDPDLAAPAEDPIVDAPEAADVMDDAQDSDPDGDPEPVEAEADAEADVALPAEPDAEHDPAHVPDISVQDAPVRATNALNLPDFAQPEDSGPPHAGPGLLARAASLTLLSPEQARAIAAQMPVLQQRLDRLNGAGQDDV